jgi:uncharacterized membrane protein (UPF0182 family)
MPPIKLISFYHTRYYASFILFRLFFNSVTAFVLLRFTLLFLCVLSLVWWTLWGAPHALTVKYLCIWSIAVKGGDKSLHAYQKVLILRLIHRQLVLYSALICPNLCKSYWTQMQQCYAGPNRKWHSQLLSPNARAKLPKEHQETSLFNCF